MSNYIISIHAPVKGATLCQLVAVTRCNDFNPRTREGCDVQTVTRRIAKIPISIHAPVKGATPGH